MHKDTEPKIRKSVRELLESLDEKPGRPTNTALYAMSIETVARLLQNDRSYLTTSGLPADAEIIDTFIRVDPESNGERCYLCLRVVSAEHEPDEPVKWIGLRQQQPAPSLREKLQAKLIEARHQRKR